jgi:hypothetical protein
MATAGTPAAAVSTVGMAAGLAAVVMEEVVVRVGA